jgi:hypothetical protein
MHVEISDGDEGEVVRAYWSKEKEVYLTCLDAF